MPVLGYGQVSSIAPEIFKDAGDSIVAGIRRTGQEIRTNLRTIQTNKQLNAFGQEAQTLDPAAPNFASSLMGLAGKYPLAASSEAGQMMVGLLGAANKNALGLEMDSRNFNQQRALNVQRSRLGREDAMFEEGLRNQRLIETPQGMFDPQARTYVEGTEVAPKGQLIPSGGSIFDSKTQTWITPPPRPLSSAETQRNAIAEENQEMKRLGLQQASAREQRMQIEANIDRALKEKQILLSQKDEAGKPLDPNGRIPFLDAEIDKSARQLQELQVLEMPFVPRSSPAAPAVLGGLNPPPLLPIDPMNSGAPVPQLGSGGGSLLPAPGVLPQGGQKRNARQYLGLP